VSTYCGGVVGDESGRLLSATLDSGKTYYVHVEPSIGFMKARFSLVPVTSAELQKESFRKDLGKCEWVIQSPTAKEWFIENRASLLGKVDTAKEKFDKADASDREIITPQYGVITPVEPL